MSEIFTRHTITLDSKSKAIFKSADTANLGLSATIRLMAREWQAHHDPDAATLALPENLAILVDTQAEYTTEGEE